MEQNYIKWIRSKVGHERIIPVSDGFEKEVFINTAKTKAPFAEVELFLAFCLGFGIMELVCW